MSAMMMSRTLCLAFIAATAAFSAIEPTPAPTPAPTEAGCFNYYSGTCSGCGKPKMCGYSPHDGTTNYAMPTFYTGNSPYCAHCPKGEGCWDGNFCGYSQTGTGEFDEECGKQHCTCVTEDRCIANSPSYVPCSTCGADGDPDLKELPQPKDPADSDRCYHMDAFDGMDAHKCHCEQTKEECDATGGFWTDTCIPVCNPDPPSPPPMMGPFNVFEFKTKAAFDACDFSDPATSTMIPQDDDSNALDPNDKSNTVTFGTPNLVDGEGTPVRYFGGSPTPYCLSGQKLTAAGGTLELQERTARINLGFEKGITFRVKDWGNPEAWTEAGFRFSFMSASDTIIFDYPSMAPQPDDWVEPTAAPTPAPTDGCNGVVYPDTGKACYTEYGENNSCSRSCDVGWRDENGEKLPGCKCASCGCTMECCAN